MKRRALPLFLGLFFLCSMPCGWTQDAQSESPHGRSRPASAMHLLDEPLQLNLIERYGTQISGSRGEAWAVVPVRIYSTSNNQTQVQAVDLEDWLADAGELFARGGSEEGRFLRKREGFLPVWGVRASVPQILSLSLGFIVGPITESIESGNEQAYGVLVQIEPGVAGGKASVGVAWAGDLALSTYHGPESIFDPLRFGGIGVKASVLRTWGKPVEIDFHAPDGIFRNLEPNHTYVGAELDLAYAVKVSFGYLLGIDTENIFTFGVGLGF
ncbi:MAG: hypothetical protein AB1540_13265 [Bdellovibrionota bacterium]